MKKKTIAAIAAFVAICSLAASRAQAAPTSTVAAPSVITQNLHLRSVGQEVVKLQTFLLQKNLLPVPAPTGYFGPLTEKAVKTLQAAHGIPTTGTVGPLTRVAIAVISISGAPAAVPQPSQADQTAPGTVATNAVQVTTVIPDVVPDRHHNAPPPHADAVAVDYPTVSQTSPADQATGVAYDRGFKVVFSHSMDSSSFDSNSVQVTAGGSTVSGAVVYHPLQKIAVFYPYAKFASSTKVTVVLSQGVKDSAGVGLQNPYSFSFTTGSSGTVGSSISLGSASTYGIVASSIANTDPTKVTGDVAALTATNGMPGSISGASHLGDATASTALTDADSAAISADLYACDSTSTAADIGGTTFAPGTYCYTGPVTLTGTTTLSGSGEHIFKFNSTFTMNPSSAVTVVNGANPNGAYWDSQGTTNIQASSHILGTVISVGSVTTGTNTLVDGRMLVGNSTATLASTTASVPGSVYCTSELPVHRRGATAFLTHSGGIPTAAYVATDGTTVTGEINAQSCDFGVYVPPNATVVIKNATIHDANQAGVFNDGAAVTVSTSTIYNIGDHANDGASGGAFSLGGTQTGFGIYVATSSTATINGNTIYNYQKGGILARILAGVFIRNNTITGAGTTTVLAQNGVQLGFPDTAVSSTTISNFTGNTVTGNIYGPSASSVGVLGSLVPGEDANALMMTATSTNSLFGNQAGQDVVIF